MNSPSGRREHGSDHASKRSARTQDSPRGPCPDFRLWVVFGDSAKIGAGRAQLLEAIERLGSIQAAAEQFGMSYRYAWGYLRELEAAAGFRFITRRRGGPTPGAQLTPEGKQFLARYWKFHARVAKAASWEFPRVFGRS